MSKSVVERLWEVNPEAEIWWDSSPIIYENWRNKMIQKAANKEEMKVWLDRLYNKDNPPEKNIFRGSRPIPHCLTMPSRMIRIIGRSGWTT